MCVCVFVCARANLNNLTQCWEIKLTHSRNLKTFDTKENFTNFHGCFSRSLNKKNTPRAYPR